MDPVYITVIHLLLLILADGVLWLVFWFSLFSLLPLPVFFSCSSVLGRAWRMEQQRDTPVALS